VDKKIIAETYQLLNPAVIVRDLFALPADASAQGGHTCLATTIDARQSSNTGETK